MSRTQDLVLARLRLLAGRWSTPAGPDHRPVAAGPEAKPGHPSPGGGGSGIAPTSGAPMWVRLVAAIAAVVVLGGLAGLLWARPRAEDAPSGNGGGAPSSSLVALDPFASPSPTPAPSVVVHVVGQVRRPGVVVLPAGSRVADAVAAAGGLRRGGRLGATNLARILSDGERVDVGGADASAAGGASGAGGGAGGPIDLNTATAEQLDSLPGIGPVTAAKILAWRATHGRFTVVEELAEVPGIGPKTLAELAPRVRV